MVKYAGGTPVFVQTLPNDAFILRASQVEAATTPKTKIVIANSPNNPTGSVIPPMEFARLQDFCNRHNVWLLSDECYSHFVYKDAKPFSAASIPGPKDRLIVAGSFSKTFAMTGLRLGYILAPKPLVDAIAKLQSQSTSNPTSIIQYAGLAAMRGSMDSVTAMLEEYARRREHILAGLRAIPGVTCTPPMGAFYVFPNVAAHFNPQMPDTTAVAKQLLEREHVAVTPGEAFGAPGFLRLSYATSMERIDEGLRRLARFFGKAA
jgi:aspartate aminotransferase